LGLVDALPTEVEARLPGITGAQRHSLYTYLEKGWQAVDLGMADEVNIRRGEGLAAEHGYLRTDEFTGRRDERRRIFSARKMFKLLALFGCK
jgi:hypothetical protein